MRRTRFAAAAVLVLMLASCSGGDDGGSSSCTPGDPVLVIDAIPDAVAAVEAELGGPQRYFEINATEVLVNLFVASPDGAKATPYAFAAGQLSSKEAFDAQGNTFEASALEIDPQLVSSCIAGQLPASSQDLFIVEGGAGGAVRYTILTTSTNGGQLLVEVGGDGAVLSVEPVGG